MAADEHRVPKLQELLADTRTPETTLIAVVFVDPAIDSCAKFCAKLSGLADQITGNAGETARLSVVLANEDCSAEALAPLQEEFTSTPQIVVHAALRHALSLSFVSTYPEMAIVDASTWSVISTDGVAALQRGSLTAASFPAGWRTNTVTAVVLPAAGGTPACSSGVAMHPEDVFNCGLYAGDTALFRSLAAGSFAPSCCVFVNAPEDQHKLPTDSAERGTVCMSALTAANLGVCTGDRLSVELCNPPDAEKVSLRTLSQVPETHNGALLGIIRDYFGVNRPNNAPETADDALDDLSALLSQMTDPTVLASGLAASGVEDRLDAAVAKLSEVSAAEQTEHAAVLASKDYSWVGAHARNARCLRRPLGTGFVFAVPVLGLGVPSVSMREAPENTTPAQAKLYAAARQALEAAGGSEPGEQGELRLANLEKVAQGAVHDAEWIAFEVTATAPRGTVTVKPSTDIQLA